MKVTEVIERFYMYFLKTFLISVNTAILFCIMPDYNHGISKPLFQAEF